ncbi:hypothetical protein [Williamsia muralis]|uniref:Uncharacterized protein n=1 Tax=Williamsia marianensis TaxID=85044 RepID=A0A2G3PPI1_WILMA|nr:hypothetical protein [Williamsia marianensis]PHV66982.1 hypothetical protein CSW57_12175 [Williamsia marianensis]
MTTTTPRRSATRTPAALIALAVAGSVLSIISLIGPTWLFSPAQPANNVPEMSFSFGDLADLSGNSPSTVQSSYFGWLAWVLVVATIVLAVAAILSRSTLIAAAEGILALVTLVVTIFAVKGPLTWGGFYDTLPNMRIGGYLIIVGLLGIIAHAVVMARSSRT